MRNTRSVANLATSEFSNSPSGYCSKQVTSLTTSSGATETCSFHRAAGAAMGFSPTSQSTDSPPAVSPSCSQDRRDPDSPMHLTAADQLMVGWKCSYLHQGG